MSTQMAIHRSWLGKIRSAKCRQSQTSPLYVVGGRHSRACGMILHDECLEDMHVYHDPICTTLELAWKGTYIVSSILFSRILSPTLQALRFLYIQSSPDFGVSTFCREPMIIEVYLIVLLQ